MQAAQPYSHSKVKNTFKQHLEAAETAIHHRYKEIEAKYAKLQSEKAQFDANFCGKADERLTLNVGGSAITVERGALTQFKRTGLAALFCGRYDKDIDHDRNGNFFLDLDPAAFATLADHLTAIKQGRIRVGEKEMMAPLDQHPSIDSLIDHFKLRAYLTGMLDDESQKQHRMQRKKTLFEAPSNPTLDEIAARSAFLAPVIHEFTVMMQALFEEEKKLAKWEENAEEESVMEFDRAFVELYKRRETDPIEYIDSLDAQFLVKKSTFKLSPFLYGLQRNSAGVVILTNPGSIVNKILEYLRRRKIRMDDLHIGNLFVNDAEYTFFEQTVRSFGILDDIKARATLKRFQPGPPAPLPLGMGIGDAVPLAAPAGPGMQSGQRPGAQQMQAGMASGQPAGYDYPQGGGQGDVPAGWTAAQWQAYQQQYQQAYQQWYQQQQAYYQNAQAAWAAFYDQQAQAKKARRRV